MAFVCCCEKYVVVAAASHVFVVPRESGENESQPRPMSLPAVISDQSAVPKNQEDDSMDGQEQKGKRTKNANSEITTPQILAVGFSPSGRLLAASNNRKQLILWRESDGRWTQEMYWNLEKQATAFAFSGTNEKTILIADRYGQVTEYDLESPVGSPGRVILGHLSMLLDLCLSKSGRYLITADRDEKIRVSHYPKSYDIQAFCLGHTEYVRTVCLCPGLRREDSEEGILASGGGDGQLKLWRYVDGIELASIDLGKAEVPAAAGDGKAQQKRIRKILCGPGMEESSGFRLIVSFEGSSQLQFLDIRCTTDGAYTVENQTDWAPDHSSISNVSDIACVNGPVYVLLSGSSESKIIEVDASSSNTQSSTVAARLNACSELSQCLAQSKEELPPMEKTVQFDNMGEYMERKRARIDAHKPM